MACKTKKYINPTKTIDSWATSDCVVHLANAEYYATKEWVDGKLEDIGGVTEEKVNEIVDNKTRPIKNQVDDMLVQLGLKASVDYVDEKTGDLQTQIDNMLKSVLSRDVLDNAIGNYAKVNGEELILNAENLK